MSATEKAEEEWAEAEKAFSDLEAELDAQPQLETKKPKHFRVSNNKNQRPSKEGHSGFTEKFVEHGCYSIDVWDSQTKGYNIRMQQHQEVNVGDVLWLPESQKNDRVYRGVVKTPFRQSSTGNPSFYSRADVLEMAVLKSHDTDYPHWTDADPVRRKAWRDKRCEYICQVEWSGPVEMNKSVLNEGFIGKTIATRNEKQGLALDKEFFSLSVEIEKVKVNENTKTVVYVSLGDEVEARSNRPSGSKLHNRIHIHYNDGSTEERGTGWLTFMREGNWYHLGGDKDKPILYKIDLTKKNRWNRRGINQDLAHSLYHSSGFNKS